MNNMNKKTYMLPGDERIVAGNAEEFVHELRVGSWMDSDCTDEQYMHNFAERYVVQAGVCRIRGCRCRNISCRSTRRSESSPADRR